MDFNPPTDFDQAQKQVQNTAKGISVAIIIIIVLAVMSTVGGCVVGGICFMRHRRRQRSIREKFSGGGPGPGYNYQVVGGGGNGEYGRFVDPAGANPYGHAQPAPPQWPQQIAPQPNNSSSQPPANHSGEQQASAPPSLPPPEYQTVDPLSTPSRT